MYVLSFQSQRSDVFGVRVLTKLIGLLKELGCTCRSSETLDPDCASALRKVTLGSEQTEESFIGAVGCSITLLLVSSTNAQHVWETSQRPQGTPVVNALCLVLPLTLGIGNKTRPTPPRRKMLLSNPYNKPVLDCSEQRESLELLHSLLSFVL